MVFIPVAAITQEDLLYFGMLLFLVLMGLLASFTYGLWLNRSTSCPSPYTGNPLRKGADIHWLTREKVLRYLFNMHDYNNRMFDLTRAAFCRDTGRVFPEAYTWFGTMKVGWDFLRKRYPGKFVSWGSLTEEQKIAIIDRHQSLEGFQTERSSPRASPREIEQDYVYTIPGPLYVDIDTGVVLGWKRVPETDLEVLILQKPDEEYIPGLHKKY